MDSGPIIRWLPLSQAVQKRAARLQSGKGRTRTGLFVVEGFRLVESAIIHHWPLEALIVRDENSTRSRLTRLLAGADLAACRIYLATANEIRKISDTVEPPGIMALARAKDEPPPDGRLAGSRFLIVDTVRDPGNMGALLRSAAAFGVDAVYLTPGSADPFNPKVVRASMGAIFALPVHTGQKPTTLAAKLQKAKIPIFVADPHEGKPVPAKPLRKWSLVVGGETTGYSQVWKSGAMRPIRIPTTGKIESLNSAVAGGILLFALAGSQI
jgi:TrmH family RNA methyltransferase